MRNVELKARMPESTQADAICRALGAEARGMLHQTDTYFAVPQGRLKLREQAPGGAELIFYRRPNDFGPKASDYVAEPANSGIKDVLGHAYGVIGIIEKTRKLYLWKNVRIHVDDVAGLGPFLEFEAVLSEKHTERDGESKVSFLMRLFSIKEQDLVSGSYLDLLEGVPQQALAFQKTGS